jgi:secreted trypsin-like serine protease
MDAMKRMTMIVGVLVVLAVVALPAAAITWGDRDNDEHPNVGMISRPDPYNPGKQRPLCSGTLIDPQVFLTAGHCTDYLKTLIAAGQLEVSQVKVSFDPDNALEADLLSVAEIITHPDYNWGPTSNPHDVGVLILAEVVNDIDLAQLPEEGFLDDLRAAGALNQGKTKGKFILVGYGTTLEWPPPNIVAIDGVRRVSESEYRALLKSWLRMSQNQATGDGGTCGGDSGGPAFWADPDSGQETLVGITSWGDPYCVATGFNYRVDIPDTLDFIADVIDDY